MQFRDYQSRELLYTSEERTRRRNEIAQAEQEVDALRSRYFGPEGEFFNQQQTLMRPVQEKLLAAVETVATREGFDYVMDRQGEVVLLFARAAGDLTERVMRELGINTARPAAGTRDN